MQEKSNRNQQYHNRINRTAAMIFTVMIIIMAAGSFNACGKNDKNNADIDTNTVNHTNEKEELLVDFINVGKGDCILIRYEENVYMIDTGYEETAPDVISFLEENNVEKIDVMIITHYDKDHVGGAAQLMETFDVKQIYGPDYEGEGSKYKKFVKKINKLGMNDRFLRITETTDILVGDMKMYIYPPLEKAYDEENDYSLVTRIEYREDSFLFAGDAEEKRINELLGNPMLKSDVLKLPHHGRLGLNNIQLIDEVNPSYSVITCEDEAEVSTSIIYELENIDSKYYFNCKGNIRCVSDGTGTIRITQDDEQK